MSSFFSDAGPNRPWPLRGGGSYTALGQGNAWSSGMAANAVLLAYRWANPDYDLVLWGIGIQIPCAVAFTANQLAGISAYKASNFTTMYTGGTDISSGFGVARDSNMPTISYFNGLSIRMASAGTTGLTAPTPAPTLSNLFFAEATGTGTTVGIPKPGSYRSFINNPIVLHKDEGGVVTLASALSGSGAIAPQFVLDFDIVPTSVTSHIYS